MTTDSNATVQFIKKVTYVGFWINAALVVLKLIFGYWGHSDALVADGYHSLSDFVTDFIVLIFVGTAYKQADKDHPYGHGKFETLATLIIGVMLMCVAFLIGFTGVTKILNSMNGIVLPKPKAVTIFVAIISIVSKEFCYQFTIRSGKKVNSSALIANAWHHRSDAFSSIATLVGVSLAFFLGESWRILDPITSVLISLFIGFSAINIARPSLNELLEVSIPEDQINEIQKLIEKIDGVIKVENLRSRKNGHSYIIDLNIMVDPNITVYAGHQIATNVENSLHDKLGNDIITYIHVEPLTK